MILMSLLLSVQFLKIHIGSYLEMVVSFIVYSFILWILLKQVNILIYIYMYVCIYLILYIYILVSLKPLMILHISPNDSPVYLVLLRKRKCSSSLLNLMKKLFHIITKRKWKVFEERISRKLDDYNCKPFLPLKINSYLY